MSTLPGTVEQRKAAFLKLSPADRIRRFAAMTREEKEEAFYWLNEANTPETATVETVPTEGRMITPGTHVLVRFAAIPRRLQYPVYSVSHVTSTAPPEHVSGQVTAGGRKCDDIGVWDDLQVIFGDVLNPDRQVGPIRLSSRDVEILEPDKCPRLGTVEKATKA